MTRPDLPRPKIDYKAIAFPSDRITVADLRRAHPERFDAEGGDRFRRTEADPTFDLDGVIRMERLLARAAFERAGGLPGDALGDAYMTRRDCLDDLTQCYKTYHVAKGRRHTEELVRDIEAQAAAQAGRRR